MDNFANIGKAAIIQSLGIQKNYTEEIETTVDAIDYSNTACSTCKYKAIINTFDPAYDKLKRKKTIRCFRELMESFYNEQKEMSS
mgnify:CR=1 FL=1